MRAATVTHRFRGSRKHRGSSGEILGNLLLTLWIVLVRSCVVGDNVAMLIPMRRAAAMFMFSCIPLVAVSALAQSQSVLLIPDTSGDKIWAFNAFDGSVISNNFIPNDGRMKQVIQVAQTPQGTFLLADVGNDQGCSADDAVREYSRCGQYIRTLAGPSDGVCNPEGICIAYGKVWFIRLYDGAFETTPGANAIWSMNYDGTGLTQVCASPSFGKTWSLFPYNGGFLVGDILDHNLEFAPLNCATSAPFYTAGQGGGTMRTPQQIQVLPDGTVIAMFFSGSAGASLFSPTGELQGQISTPTGRGVYPLGNGEVMFSGGTQVQAFNPVTSQLRTIVNQITPLSSFRWISPATLLPCPADLNCSSTVDGADLGALLGNWGSAGTGDLDGDGAVNGSDLGILLGNWGSCG